MIARGTPACDGRHGRRGWRAPQADLYDPGVIDARATAGSGSRMTGEIESLYGSHRPNMFLRALVAGAQRAPRNAIGRHFAHALRSIVIACASPPLDVEVGAIRMRCRFRDNHSEKKFVFTPWRFDVAERDFLVRALPPDGTFVDIGANVGIYTLTAAMHLGDAGRIIALEPNPAMFARLEFNLGATCGQKGPGPAIDLLPVGVSDIAGSIELHLDEANLGGSSIVDRPAGGRSIRIVCRLLATVLQECGVERIDVLKIDIEGAEDRALVPYLEQAPPAGLPANIIIERSEHRWRRDLAGAMADRGYRCILQTRMNRIFSRERTRP